MLRVWIAPLLLLSIGLGSSGLASEPEGEPEPGLAGGESVASDQGSWEVIRQEEGVVVSRRVEGAGAPVRARAEIDASLFEVLAVLADDSRRTEWLPRCIESRVLSEVKEGRMVLYNRTEGDWPISDRDAVVESQVTISPDQRSALIEMRSTTSAAAPPVDGVVRMPELSGAYRLHSVTPTRTQIEYEVEVDLGGSVPGFVLNFVRDQMPFDTLKQLRSQVEDTRGAYHAEIAALQAELPSVSTGP